MKVISKNKSALHERKGKCQEIEKRINLDEIEVGPHIKKRKECKI